MHADEEDSPMPQFAAWQMLAVVALSAVLLLGMLFWGYIWGMRRCLGDERKVDDKRWMGDAYNEWRNSQ
jgi:hypothetical protein